MSFFLNVPNQVDKVHSRELSSTLRCNTMKKEKNYEKKILKRKKEEEEEDDDD